MPARTPLLAATLLVACSTPPAPAPVAYVAVPAAPSACPRDGDRITVTGHLGVGHVTPSDDPSKHAQSYLFIVFDSPVCVIEPGAPAGEPVAHAEFLTERPPLKSMLGVVNTYTGSIEHGADTPTEKFSFVAY